MSQESSDPISFVHALDRQRYEVRDGDSLAGFTEYRIPDSEHVDFVHTEVDDAWSGQGLASRLVAFALADVVEQGRRIIPHCSYVAGWLQRHEEYDEVTDRPA
jgi:predicted GNAT family acetyltransferase